MPGFQKTRPPCRNLFAAVLFSSAALVCLVGAGCHSSPVASRPPLTPQQERGKGVYDARCVSCHDPNSDKPRQGPGLGGMFRKKYLPSGLPANDDRARDAIVMGRGTMPGFHAALDEQETNDLLAYLHTL